LGEIMNIKLTLEYDGTNYAGWQKQLNAVAVQQIIEAAIYKVTSEKVEVIGASRTDTGVHAKAYVLNFFTESTIPPERFKAALNCKLPEDIVILKSEEVSIEFHARYSSTGKRYCYSILNGLDKPAIGRNYVGYHKAPLDVEAMQEACKLFIGKKDFSAFRNLGSSVKSTTRTIKESYIVQEGNIIKYYVSADGFLYNMVRIIVGTLLQVGNGKLMLEEIPLIIASKDRKMAGKSAPASGLCLEEVYY
jgi:tRNA pseudouridine38-40 synthase